MLHKSRKLLTIFIILAVIASCLVSTFTSSKEIPLVFAGDIDYPPYSYRSKGSPKGYLIDLSELLGATMDRKILIELMPWKNCLNAIQSGKVDGLIGSIVNERWSEFMDYSKPILEIEYAIFVESKNRYINSIKSLEGTIVGISKDCYIIDKFNHSKRIKLLETDTVLEAFRKLEKREITAVIAEKNTALYYINQQNLSDIRMAAPISDLIYSYSMAVKKDDKELLGSLDRGLTILNRNGSLQRLNKRWFGTYSISYFPWKTVILMTAKITGALLVFLIILWIISLRATVNLKTQQIQRISRRMVEKEKLTVLGKMAGQIAHELRTPLGIIKNSVYLLRNEDPSNRAAFEKRLHMLEDKIKLSSDILESILSYSRVKAEVPSEVSIKECLEEVLKDLDMPKSIKTDVTFEKDSPLAVYMDFHQLYSVLRNLLLNAIQAIGETGEVTIRGYLSDHGRKANIEICDTGEGIAESARNKIFNLFYSTKPAGTGLGLSISKSIVEANDGELHLDESTEQGTCFTITLPTTKPSQKA